ncbi:glycosyltransferase family protein [uncultured Fusobacterium sp.]|uniref:glycosyltransferase family protein n=1 Tax=uncultured Fusobacterium sp. TaxID=159267 RepID=UPI0025E1E661|nr:glycosyltransferase family protein [uncultured Fusobacterium sp.]
MVKVGAIIQARMGSSRLPNKILKKLPYFSEETILSNIISRATEVKEIDEIVVATTQNIEDDKIEEYCKSKNIKYYRGSENNVLKRFYEAAKTNELDIIIRLTSDNPIIDISLLSETVSFFKEKDNINYLRTINTPIGMGVEIFDKTSLEINYINSKDKFEQEHVTPYFYKTCPKKFNIIEYQSKIFDKSYNWRFTVDTNEDYTFICCLFDELYEKNKFFSIIEIEKLYQDKPWIFNININTEQKKVCSNLNEEIEEAIKLLNKQDLNRVEKYLKEQYYGKDK